MYFYKVKQKQLVIMVFNKETLQKKLRQEYKMENSVYALGQDVTFYGTELECYKMAYKFKNKKNTVAYSKNLKTWYVCFSEWFSVDFSQKIA